MAETEDPTAKNTRRDKSNYGTKYPFNQVLVTESGHEVHYDNTPGKERIRIAHKDGSYTEWTAGGKKVEVIVGNSQQYHKGGCTVTIDNNQDVKISGHSRVIMGGGSHIEVAGDATVAVGGDSLNVTMGDSKTAVAGALHLFAAGDGNINIKGNMDMKVGGNMVTTVKGDQRTGVAGATEHVTAGDNVIQAANIRLN